LVIDTVVCLTLAKWETVSGQFGGYLKPTNATLAPGSVPPIRREQKKAPAIFAEASRYRGVSTRRAVVL